MTDASSGAQGEDGYTLRRRSPATVVAGLEKWLPGKLGVRAVAVRNLATPGGSGFSNETYLFSAQWDGGRADLVLQAAPIGSALFRTYDLEAMFRVQERVGEISSVPVPRMRGYESDPAVLGSPFYVMDRVPGRIPTDHPPYHKEGWLTEVSPEWRRRAWESGVDAMARLHALDVESDGFGFLADAPWGMRVCADAVAERLRAWREFLTWAAEEPLPIVLEALDELERTRPRVPQRLAVHWGDAKLSNCVLDERGVAALLDWELCGLSDPEEDLAHWLMLDWFLESTSGSARLEGLPGRVETVARYEERTGRPTHAVEWWFRFSLVRLSIITHRVMAQVRRNGMIPADVDLASVNPVAFLVRPLFEREGLP
jgi:aminoglycoside phosphotransferase (APT) family kinase protein